MYQVKWTQNGKVCYGIHEQYGVHKSKREGYATVSDAILGTLHELPIESLTEIQCSWDPPDEFQQFVESEYQKAVKLSDSLSGLQPGKLFSVGVADGCAYYVVTKVNKRSVKVEWRGFQGDRYTDQVLGYGGSFPRDTIERIVLAEEGMREIFAKER